MTSETTLHVRAATADDTTALRRLGWEGFASTPRPVEDGTPHPDPARASVACDGAAIVGKAVDLELESWYGGRRVPTSGVAGVVLAAEYRGRGALRPLLGHLLDAARDRGAVVSTLYPSAPGFYRSIGYEVIGEYAGVEVPTWALARAGRAGHGKVDGESDQMAVRRAVASDWPRIAACYDAWAAGSTGALTRVGPRFAGSVEELAEDATGVSVVERPDDPYGPLAGYCCWERVRGYQDEAGLRVHDLIAPSAPAATALLGLLGGHEPTARTTRFRANSGRELAWFLADDVARVVSTTPYMLAVLDVPGAVAARGYGGAARGSVKLTVREAALPGVAGRYQLSWADGRGVAERVGGTDAEGPWLTGRGLAVRYAGAHPCARLRRLGLMGGDETYDALLDAAFAAGPVDVRDYF